MTVQIPALTAPPKPKKLTSAERTLDNGLRVLAVRKPGVPLVEFRLRIPFLSPRETHPARATVLSDSVLTGTVALDRSGFAAAVQALGGDVNVGVDADRLLFSGNVLATNLAALLELLSGVLTGATYPKAEVTTERERLVEKLTIARSRAGVIANEALGKRMFGSHPYALDLPTAEAVQATEAAHVRRLHADRVLPDGAVLVVVGDVTPARAIGTVQAALAGWTGTPKAARVRGLPPIAPGPVQIIDRPGSVQSSLRMGRTGLRRDDLAYPALQLANLIFGGYFSSRWTENIREDKGYTYGPHSRVDHHALGTSLTLDADVATEVTAPALLETIYELGRISTLPVTADEVESVRQYAIGTLALSTATQAGLASTIAALAGTGLGLDWLAEHPRRLAKVSVEEVTAAAAEHFAPSTFVTVIVGDAETITGPLERIVPVG